MAAESIALTAFAITAVIVAYLDGREDGRRAERRRWRKRPDDSLEVTAMVGGEVRIVPITQLREPRASDRIVNVHVHYSAEDGGHIATAPEAYPGLSAFGVTVPEALRELNEAIIGAEEIRQGGSHG